MTVADEFRAEGHAIGRAEGHAIGRAKGHLDVAHNLVIRGMDDDFILETTQISPAQLQQLKEEAIQPN